MTSAKKRLVGLGLFGVGLSAAAGSGVGLWGLAGQVGYPLWLRWILWLSLDAYGLLAGLVWALAPAAGLRRYAAANTIIAVGLSILGNGLYHALTAPAGADGAPLVRINVWIVMATTGVPPAVVAAVAHMWIMLTHASESRAQNFAVEDPSGQAQTSPPVVPQTGGADFAPAAVLTSDSAPSGGELACTEFRPAGSELAGAGVRFLDPSEEAQNDAQISPPAAPRISLSKAHDEAQDFASEEPRRSARKRTSDTMPAGARGRLRVVKQSPEEWIAEYVAEHGEMPKGTAVAAQFKKSARWGQQQVKDYRAQEPAKGAVGQ